MMTRILAVAANTRKEAFRNRVFIVLVLIGFGLNAVGWALSKLAHSTQHGRVMQNFGYFAVSMIAVVTAILMGVILLYKELDRKTIFTLIPKPIHRFEIVLGKFVGLATLLAALTTILGLAWIAIMKQANLLHVGGTSILSSALLSLVLIWLEAVLITAVALLFSGWTRPVMSGAFTVGYFLMGRWVELLQDHLAAKSGFLAEPGLARGLAIIATWVVPDLGTFNVSRELSLGVEVTADYVLAATQYAFSFAAIFLVIGIALFSRRDFV